MLCDLCKRDERLKGSSLCAVCREGVARALGAADSRVQILMRYWERAKRSDDHKRVAEIEHDLEALGVRYGH